MMYLLRTKLETRKCSNSLEYTPLKDFQFIRIKHTSDINISGTCEGSIMHKTKFQVEQRIDKSSGSGVT